MALSVMITAEVEKSRASVSCLYCIYNNTDCHHSQLFFAFGADIIRYDKYGSFADEEVALTILMN